MFQKAFQTIKSSLGIETEQKAIALSDPDIAEIFNILPTASGIVINPTTAIRVPAVLQALRLISQACGSLPFKTYTETREVAKAHPSYNLVHGFANGWTSAGAFREALTTDALIHGAGYGLVLRNADGMLISVEK